MYKSISGAIRTIVAGGMGGVALWVSIFPADVVKSRVQVESTAGTVEPTFRSVLRHVFKEEGTSVIFLSNSNLR